ncbi:hypothetical protein ElyMa_001409100 [Elysia marginata]|uniref:Uncharacterized protein n=1 Tax=Elysia marginata TaxID=1093978 RepID=A0AAV4IY07_9GAST|nr:hypothetical protein ElyMa_001409100 [Elysia marginata]
MVPPYYCPRRKAYETKRFFSGKTLTSLHADHTADCVTAGTRGLAPKFFSDTFHRETMSFHIPWKDQCDTCVSFQHNSIGRTAYEIHIKKMLHKNKKLTTKLNVKGMKHVTSGQWTFRK